MGAGSGAMGDPVDDTGDAHIEANDAEPPCKLEPVPAAAGGASHTPADAAAPAKASDQVPKTVTRCPRWLLLHYRNRFRHLHMHDAPRPVAMPLNYALKSVI